VAVASGTNPTPTDTQASGGSYCYKATGTPREWIAFATADQFYFFNVFNATTFSSGTHCWLMVGDMVGDYASAYSTFIAAPQSASQPLPGFYDAYFHTSAASNSYVYMLRATSAASTRCNLVAFGTTSYMGYNDVIPISSGLHISPIRVHEPSGPVWGTIPGIFVPGAARPYAALDTFTTGSGSPLGAREFIVIFGSSGQAQAQMYVDISTDWTT
jgi:hypothetical protein